MNIVYAADNNFVDVLYASIKSLYNANHDFKINLWIIADNVSDENKNKINDLSQEYGQRKICWVDNVEIPYKLQLDRGSASAFSRLLLGSILPKNISKVLYLDSDLLVTDDLTDLFELDLGDNYLAATRSCFSAGIGFNAGVLLINNKKLFL